MFKKSCFVVTALLAICYSAVSTADEVKVRAELAKIMPQASEAKISKAPLDGVYQVELRGRFFYAFAKDDHFMIGDLYDSKRLVNLSEEAASERMAAKIAEVPVSKMIVYGPEKPKRYINIFTDIDCGYCRRLHTEIPELNEAGIQIRYLAYPRAGIGSNSYKKYVSVWCNDDQQASLTAAKAGESVKDATCENPIADTFKLGQEVGVRGTPTMVLDDGMVVPGYVPAKQLIARLGL